MVATWLAERLKLPLLGLQQLGQPGLTSQPQEGEHLLLTLLHTTHGVQGMTTLLLLWKL